MFEEIIKLEQTCEKSGLVVVVDGTTGTVIAFCFNFCDFFNLLRFNSSKAFLSKIDFGLEILCL